MSNHFEHRKRNYCKLNSLKINDYIYILALRTIPIFCSQNFNTNKYSEIWIKTIRKSKNYNLPL